MDQGRAALLEALEGVCYIVDRSRRIVACGGRHWRRFAEANGGPVDVDAIVGRDLFDFVLGHRVRERYADVMERMARGALGQIAFSYRCDSPAVRREMRMSISPLRSEHEETVDGFLFQSMTLGEYPRPPVGLFDFTGRGRFSLEGTEPLLGLCSYCQKVRYPAGSAEGEGEWIEAEEYYRRGGSAEVQISHGICEPCFHQVQEEVLGEIEEL